MSCLIINAMKNIRIVFLFLFGAITMTGCKKTYPTGTPPAAPEFTFSGTIGGNSVNLQAGVNNYYMFTSCLRDSNGVYDFIGEFRDKSCSSNCPNSLKIYIKEPIKLP